ncbi:pregnancy-specific glycoprotein 22-like [Peromyscus maniculatus bairdii]|uniref:pregnancy-specific glycoprotein 22-like n=1 Tax=Peromyscus maniculatus bairdii TaxID=230844 RepID=UPI003FD43806
MEVCSVLLCKGCTPWRGLLLTASLLSCWHLSTTARFALESVPPEVIEGENAFFLVHNLPENLAAVVWSKRVKSMNHGIVTYALNKDLSVPGPLHSGRETVYRNGSLLLRNVTRKDTGLYTIELLDRLGDIVSTITAYLRVHIFLWTCGHHATSVQPSIESVPPSVAEGGSVLLLVHNPPLNIIAFVWFKWVNSFRKLELVKYLVDRKATLWGSAYTGRETLYSDGSLLLHGVTHKDPGVYTVRFLRTDMRNAEAEVQLKVYASLSVFCNPFTSSQLTIHPEPLYPAKGERVVLQVHNFPEDMLAFTWYKANYRTPFLKVEDHSMARTSFSWGKGMVYYNGTLMLRDVTEKDAGMYTLEVLRKHSKIEKAYAEFYIKKNMTQPFVQITDTTFAGHRSVIFTCISPDTDISIRWIFNNQNLQLTERMTLSPTNCGLRIDPVRAEDAGEYQCEVSNRLGLKTSLPVSWPR